MRKVFNPKYDNILPNGAEVLSRALVGDVWVWLCERAGYYQPYVTWISPTDNPGATVWGRYHGRFTNALHDFRQRARSYLK